MRRWCGDNEATMARWYTVVVTNDRFERIETAQWRQLLLAYPLLRSVALADCSSSALL